VFSDYSCSMAQNLKIRKPVAGTSNPDTSRNRDEALRTLALIIARVHLERLNSRGDISMQHTAQSNTSRKTKRKEVI